MDITAYFTVDSSAKTGLSPTITIVDISDGSIVVNASNMTEITNVSGWYSYDFTTMDLTKSYIATSDAGEVVDDRYPTNSFSYKDISSAIWEQVIEAGYSAEELMKLMASILVGKTTGVGTGTVSFRDVNDTTNRIVADIDGVGNRANITTTV